MSKKSEFEKLLAETELEIDDILQEKCSEDNISQKGKFNVINITNFCQSISLHINNITI